MLPLARSLPCCCSKVTWPHLLLACSTRYSFPDKNRSSEKSNEVIYLHSCTACLGVKSLKNGLCAVCSDVCLTQCQRSDQQLLPPYTQRADHTAHGNATKPLAVVIATGPLQPIKTPPLLSPLATAAAQEFCDRARHPVLHRVMCFHFYHFTSWFKWG